MTDNEKIMALPKLRKNTAKPFQVVLDGVKVTLMPHPLKSTLPMGRLEKVFRAFIAKERALESRKAKTRHVRVS